MGGKSKNKSIDSSDIPNGLPNKKCDVAVGDEVAKSEVVEVEHQPYQSQ